MLGRGSASVGEDPGGQGEGGRGQEEDGSSGAPDVKNKVFCHRLLDVEARNCQLLEGVTAVTIFKGDPRGMVHVLTERLHPVLEANPWVGGVLTKRLVETESGKLKKCSCLSSRAVGTNPKVEREKCGDVNSMPIFLSEKEREERSHVRQKNKAPISEPIFGVKDILFSDVKLDVSSTMHFKTLFKQIQNCKAKGKPLVIPAGMQLIDKDEPIVRIVVSKQNENGEFALVASISHSVADGATFYRFLNMLSPGQPIVSLDARRQHAIQTQLKAYTGVREERWQNSPGFVLGLCCSVLRQSICGPKPRVLAYYVDPDRVAKAKGQCDSFKTEYISTNDILTSFVGNATDSRVICMALNCRERVQGCTSDLAGNYESGVLYDSDVFAKPEGIRVSLGRKEQLSSVETFPSCCSFLPRSNAAFTLVTNWSSSSCAFEYGPDIKQVLHLPYFAPESTAWDVAIIFRPLPDQLAVLYFCKTACEETLLHKSGPHTRALFPL